MAKHATLGLKAQKQLARAERKRRPEWSDTTLFSHSKGKSVEYGFFWQTKTPICPTETPFRKNKTASYFANSPFYFSKPTRLKIRTPKVFWQTEDAIELHRSCRMVCRRKWGCLVCLWSSTLSDCPRFLAIHICSSRSWRSIFRIVRHWSVPIGRHRWGLSSWGCSLHSIVRLFFR